MSKILFKTFQHERSNYSHNAINFSLQLCGMRIHTCYTTTLGKSKQYAIHPYAQVCRINAFTLELYRHSDPISPCPG